MIRERGFFLFIYLMIFFFFSCMRFFVGPKTSEDLSRARARARETINFYAPETTAWKRFIKYFLYFFFFSPFFSPQIN